MKTMKNTKIIGIDHGYGNKKTANFCFSTGIIAYDSEPLFTADMLVYENKYYLIARDTRNLLPTKSKMRITIFSLLQRLQRNSKQKALPK